MLDDIQRQREKFARDAKPSQKEIDRHSNAFGGLILDNLSYVKVGDWVCHGFLNSWDLKGVMERHSIIPKPGVIKYVLSAPMKSHENKKNTKAFYDWLLNRSPWSVTHLDKDVDRCMELGFVVDAAGPANIFVSGLMASRLFTESYDQQLKHRIPVYLELVDMGLDESEAFLFCHLYGSTSPTKSLYPLVAAPYQAGHSIFHHENTNEAYYKAFLSAEFKKLSPELIYNCPNYGQVIGYGESICNLWGEKRGRNDFLSWVSRVKPVSNVQAKDLFIFRKVIKDNKYQITNRADFMSVLSQVKGRIYA